MLAQPELACLALLTRRRPAHDLVGAVFNNATALSNSEAATLMNIVLEVRKQADPAHTPNPVMQKTLEYAGTYQHKPLTLHFATACRKLCKACALRRALQHGAHKGRYVLHQAVRSCLPHTFCACMWQASG